MGLMSFVVDRFFNVITSLLLIYIIMSWFVRGQYGTLYKIYCALGVVAEPLLMPFRQLMGRFSGRSMGIDFSPILALITLQMLQGAIVRLLVSFGL